MIDDHKAGGPAFPWTADRADRGDVPGMTLRDYFAARAMQAIITNDSLLHGASEYYGDDVGSEESVARLAYDQADAMLKARAT